MQTRGMRHEHLEDTATRHSRLRCVVAPSAKRRDNRLAAGLGQWREGLAAASGCRPLPSLRPDSQASSAAGGPVTSAGGLVPMCSAVGELRVMGGASARRFIMAVTRDSSVAAKSSGQLAVVAGGHVDVVVFQFPPQARAGTADRPAARSQPDRGGVPQVTGVLADRGQAVLDGAVQVGADHRRRAARSGVDGVSTGLLAGVLRRPGPPGRPAAARCVSRQLAPGG